MNDDVPDRDKIDLKSMTDIQVLTMRDICQELHTGPGDKVFVIVNKASITPSEFLKNFPPYGTLVLKDTRLNNLLFEIEMECQRELQRRFAGE